MSFVHDKVTSPLNELAREHPIATSIFVLLAAVICIIGVIALIYNFTSASERFYSNNVLVTSPSSALDRTWGTCMSGPGQDHCGAAERFSNKSGNRSNFLNSRGSGPDFTATAALNADYWYQELSNGGTSNPADSGIDSGAGAAAQPAQENTSNFAANRRSRFSADEALLRSQTAITR